MPLGERPRSKGETLRWAPGPHVRQTTPFGAASHGVTTNAVSPQIRHHHTKHTVSITFVPSRYHSERSELVHFCAIQMFFACGTKCRRYHHECGITMKKYGITIKKTRYHHTKNTASIVFVASRCLIASAASSSQTPPLFFVSKVVAV